MNEATNVLKYIDGMILDISMLFGGLCTGAFWEPLKDTLVYRLHFLLLFGRRLHMSMFSFDESIQTSTSISQTFAHLVHLPQPDLPVNMQVIQHTAVLDSQAAALPK